jgi:gluconolactonase
MQSEQSPFVVYAPEFRDVLGPAPTYTTIPADAHEGPVYVRKWDAVLFTSVPTTNVPAAGDRNVSIGRLDLHPLKLSTFVTATDMANGMTLDREGRLLICVQGTLRRPARIARMDLETKQSETVVESWSGLPFNSPNDIVVRSDGTIWFTDPSYGWLQGFRGAPQVGDFVYRHDPANGSTSVVADSFNKPNGLAFSPDESVLYINDSAAIQGPGTYVVTLPHHIRAFDVHAGRFLRADRLVTVVSPGIPDGLKLDSAGRIYSSSATGVQVFTPDGKLIGQILALRVANFCFGGLENDTIFAMCDTTIVMARIAVTGAIPPPV